jgi:hypothetical protein
MASVQGLRDGTRLIRITVFARWGWSSNATDAPVAELIMCVKPHAALGGRLHFDDRPSLLPGAVLTLAPFPIDGLALAGLG